MFGRKFLPFFMWLFPLLFFTYQFVLRLWPGLMMQNIMSQFAIDATGFGLLASVYYYGYSGMQIPVAILLDRFSPRYVICAFVMLCGTANLLFMYTDNFYLAMLSRFLIGAGSAAGFLGVSKVISQWFSKDMYAKMVGYSFTVGLTGAIYGGRPVSILIEQYDWRSVSLTLSIVALIIGILTYIVLRSPQNINQNQTHNEFKLSKFIELLSSPSIWMLGIANLLMVGTLEGFADVWGVSYLTKAHALSKCDAASLVSLIFFGMLAGGPLLAFFSKKFGHYSVIAACGFGMAIAFALLLLNDSYNWLYLACIFFVIGIMCCYQVIIFAAGCDMVSSANLGITVAFLNCMNMLGGSFFHTAIGKIMDLFWTGNICDKGLREYDLITYQYAISLIPISAIIGSIMVLIVKYKYKK